jgi:regulator of RNase E activity RraA
MTTGFEPLDDEQTDRLGRLSAAVIADTGHEGAAVLSAAVAPLHIDCAFVGTARTSRLDPDGLWMPLRALMNARPAEVVVVDAADEVSEAVWGELLSRYAEREGVVGLVTNGAVRDVAEIRALSYPVFARGRTPRGPSGSAEEAVDTPVTVGGATIEPGDVLVGDGTGVVAIRRDAVTAVIDTAERVEATEREVQRRIAEGEALDRILEDVGMR